MRKILLLAASFYLGMRAGSFAVDLDAGTILALEGKALFQAANKIGYTGESKLSADDLVKVAAKLGALLPQTGKNNDDRLVFDHVFSAACEKANGPQVDKLVEIYVALEPDSFEKGHQFHALATVWILREIENRSDFPKVELPALDQTPPIALANAPQELIAAWQLCKRARQTAEKTFRPAPNAAPISFQANKRTFYRLIDDVLLKRRAHLAEALTEFGWSGWCGKGIDSLQDPQSIGIFMSLLNDGRIAEAVGAVINLQNERPLVSEKTGKSARVEFLKKCGLDWESILAGAQIDTEAKPAFAGRNDTYVRELGAFGSERSAALLMQMAPRANAEMREGYARALSMFIPGKEMIAPYRGEISRHAGAVSQETQARVLEALKDFATPTTPSDVVLAALDGFAHAKAPETKPLLRALLNHPSPDVTKGAAEVLRLLGETVTVERRNPVRFQVSLNGQPAASMEELGWEVQFGTSGSASSSRQTDESGVLALERRYFLDQERKPSAVIISNHGRNTSASPYFLVKLPVPADLDQLTRVNLELSRVELRVARLLAGAEEAKAAVVIRRQEEKRDPSQPYAYFNQMPWNFVAPLDQPLILSMQSGSYEIAVTSPGAERFKTAFRVGGQAPLLTVHLKPGGDVRFEILRPDREHGARFTLLGGGQEINGTDFDYKTNTYRGLPVGNYVIHIPSSAEAVSGARNPSLRCMATRGAMSLSRSREIQRRFLIWARFDSIPRLKS